MYAEIKCCDRQTEVRQTGLSLLAAKQRRPVPMLSGPEALQQIQTGPNRAMPV